MPPRSPNSPLNLVIYILHTRPPRESQTLLRKSIISRNSNVTPFVRACTGKGAQARPDVEQASQGGVLPTVGAARAGRRGRGRGWAARGR